MRGIVISLVIGLLLSHGAQAQYYQIANGNVWDGTTFVERDLYVANGLFVSTAPAHLDSVIDATGQFVVPPFGDYHTHTFDGTYARTADSTFRSAGIFFAQELGNDPMGRKRMNAYLRQKHTIDVAFANGCLTSNFGHPIAGYERMALGINWPQNDAQRDSIRNSRIYAGRTYHILDRPAEVVPVMESLLATQPDLIKVILWNAAEYATAAETPVDNLGLDPALLPQIVRMSEAYGLPVLAHIDTEQDLLLAIRAGITRFAHAPLYSYANDGRVEADFPRLTAATLAELATGPPVVINPTLYRTFTNLRYLPEAYRPSAADLELVRSFHAALLKDLKQGKVTFVAGADMPGSNAVDEILYYDRLGAFTSAELLNMLIETSTFIFPERKIGRLAPGYEAHCLLLAADPTDRIENIRRITGRMKNGILLND